MHASKYVGIGRTNSRLFKLLPANEFDFLLLMVTKLFIALSIIDQNFSVSVIYFLTFEIIDTCHDIYEAQGNVIDLIL